MQNFLSSSSARNLKRARRRAAWVVGLVSISCAGFAREAPKIQPVSQITAHGPTLSSASARVRDIAWANGDRDFLMIDKAFGLILLFKNGEPIFIRPALTGANPADRFPSDALTKSDAETKDLRYKVTPAGRFTVTHGYDEIFGETLNINEIQGLDWDLAIHRVARGNHAQYREIRLRPDISADRHISDGCINVAVDTMAALLTFLPNAQKVPIYILPSRDESIPDFFPARRQATPSPHRS